MYVIICSGHGHSFHGKMQFLKSFGGMGRWGGGGGEREGLFCTYTGLENLSKGHKCVTL